MKSENPLTRDYWLGEVDPRPLALFRILFGSIALVVLSRRLPDVRFFFSDEGYAPRAALPMLAHGWSLFRLVGSPGAVLALYWVGLLAVAALTLGFHTRLASIATFAFLVSLHLRNPVLSIGPDRILGVMSFWLMLADAGGAWSLDRLIGRRSGATVPAAGLRLLQWQVALVYFFAALAKRSTWGGGLGIYHLMQVHDSVLPAGALLTRWPSLSIAVNWLVLATEVGVPLLLIPLAALVPKARAAGIVGGLCLFLGISLTMRVGAFPELMISTLALFLPPEWLDRIGAVDRTAVAPAPPVSLRRRKWMLAFGALQLCLVAGSLMFFQFGGSEGRWLEGEIRQLDLEQSWTMFAKQAIPLDAWWTGFGVRDDGSRAEVLEALVPELVAAEPRFDWQNFRRHLMLPTAFRERLLLARYVCRRFHRVGSAPLRALELTLHQQPVHDPAETPPEGVRDVYHLPCAGEPEGEGD